jgi:hypothetical protein
VTTTNITTAKNVHIMAVSAGLCTAADYRWCATCERVTSANIRMHRWVLSQQLLCVLGCGKINNCILLKHLPASYVGVAYTSTWQSSLVMLRSAVHHRLQPNFGAGRGMHADMLWDLQEQQHASSLRSLGAMNAS